ncbi:alpha/beta hydrolase [Mycobacterium sp.]|uniref:alpha/beta hydrolase n=1 Tax=Mycobacterium sp. TaxID=1785 RepID=UPI0025FDE621|nr:alpha/beta hydrolase [Mycobacterium sp.]
MSIRTTAKVLRRRTLTIVDRLTYVPVSRLTLNTLLNVLVSQQWLFTGLRPAADNLIARTSPVVPGVLVVPVSDPVRGEWVRAPDNDDAAGVILVLHGSGYLICSSRTHRGFASHLSEYSGMPAFTVDYRLAPEHPFPAAEDDAFAAYRWLLEQGHDPAKIVVAGDSAGGHLAVALAVRLRNEGLPLPAALALFGPLIDPSYRACIADPRVRSQPLDPRTARRAVALYVGDHDDQDPRLNLLNADLSDLPPIQIHFGSREVMRADAEAFAKQVVELGGRCDEQLWPGLMHGYWLWPRDGGFTSLQVAGQFLRSAVGLVDPVS